MRSGLGLGIFEEEQVAPVEDGEEKVSEDDGEFVEMKCVDERNEATPKAEVPEERWDDDFSLFL